MADGSQDFPIHGPGPDMAGRSVIVGRFPLGEPDFRGRSVAGKRGGGGGAAQAWRLAGVADPAAGAAVAAGGAPPAPPPPLGDPSVPWALEDAPGRPTHVSSAEGMPGGGAGYFVLVRDGAGGGFTAWPVDAWHTFRPPRRHAVPSLEEAEAAMERRARGLQALPNHARLATMLGRAAEDDRRAGRGGEGDGREVEEEEGEGGDDDDRPGRRPPAFGGGGGSRKAAVPATAAAVGAVRAGRPMGADARAEDWEHEEDRADDDVDMGEDGEDGDAAALGGGPPGGGGGAGGRGPRLARPGSLSPSAGADDDDDDDDDVFGERRPRLTGAGADLKRILAQSGMGDSDDDDEEGAAAAAKAAAAARRKAAAAAAAGATTTTVPPPSSRGRSASLSSDDDDDDDEDLDAMAEAYKPDVIARLASGAAGGGAAGAAAAAGPSGGSKPPPSRSTSPSAGGAKRKAGTPGGGGDAATKKARATTSPPPPAAGGSGPPTDAELVAALRTHGPMPSSSLTAMFKARITGPEARKEFTAAVKRVARLEDRGGARVIVLKE